MGSSSPYELRRLSPEIAKHSNNAVTLQAHKMALSQGGVSPSNQQERGELNSDLLMLMKVPKQGKGRNQLEPLKLPASLTASNDSSES